MKSSTIITAILLLLVGLGADRAALAGVPYTLNYQATLADNTGQPVTGDRSVSIGLYPAPTGGAPFWTQTFDPVALVDGRLSLVLGGEVGNPLDPDDFTGETYIGIQVDADQEMPRQKLTSVAYAFKAAEAIPPGVIVMWSGAIGNIPAGWALCDGNNGTPDLRERFIVGTGGGLSVGSTGGFATNNMSHNHGINTDGHHGHHIDVQFFSCIGDCEDGADSGSKNVGSDSHGHHLVADTHGAGNHSHGGGTHQAGNNNIENRPPYYALAFIIKL